MHYLETWKGSWGLGTSRKLVMASRVGGKIQNIPLFKLNQFLVFVQVKKKILCIILILVLRKQYICEQTSKVEVFWEGHRNLKKYAS